MRIAVIGSGSWGTALAKLLAEKNYDVRLWSRSHEMANAIETARENKKYLAGHALPSSLRSTADLAEALDRIDLVVTSVPSHGLRAFLSSHANALPAVPIVSATKGIENNTLKIVSEIFSDFLPADRSELFSCISGPSFAREVAARFPTVVTIACRSDSVAKLVQHAFATDRFRTYRTDDVTGVEVAGALKNVIAIAAGASDGLGFGTNSRAGLITRGLAEIGRLAIKRGGHPLTVAGLAGMGDLVLTCTGDLSRNRTVGMELGKGRKLSDVLAGMTMVAEGVKTAKSAYDLAVRDGVEMPITTEVYRCLYEEKAIPAALESLMTRELRTERD